MKSDYVWIITREDHDSNNAEILGVLKYKPSHDEIKSYYQGCGVWKLGSDNDDYISFTSSWDGVLVAEKHNLINSSED